jgi:hypothetical protein
MGKSSQTTLRHIKEDKTIKFKKGKGERVDRRREEI